MIFSFVITCSKDSGSNSSDEKKKWTFMFYCDEDFDPYYHRYQWFCNALCSGEEVNVIFIHDTFDDEANYAYIDEENQPIILKEPGEINMGNPNTLADFIKYCKKNYPAENYILGLYNHGGGWLGACWDYTNEGDWLTPDDIKTALQQTGKVDVFMFIAACSMGAVEMAYEVREYADYYIASENRSTAWFWQRPLFDFNRALHENPEMGPEEVSVKLINLIEDNNEQPSPYQPELTASVVRLDKMDSLVSAINTLSLMYMNNSNEFSIHLNSINEELLRYVDKAVDIHDLANLLNLIETDSLKKIQLESIKNLLNRAVLDHCNGPEMQKSRGLSIYLPNETVNPFNSYYYDESFNLDFANDTHWDELLEIYYSNIGKIIKNKYPKPENHLEM